jgi:galactitol-specific phosphotransferase system IIB component
MIITRRAVILLSVLALASCARAEGSSLQVKSEVDTAVATSEAESVEEEPPIEFIPADVDPDSIEPI